MQERTKKIRIRKPSGLSVKVIMLGDSGVGKTCLINRYVSGYYKESYTATLGVDFKIKIIQRDEGNVNLQIWDTAGQQKFKTLTKSYFQGCMGVLLVFSLTDLDSFKNIQKWLYQLDDHSNQNMVKVLIGAKCDCCGDERKVKLEECHEMAVMHGIQYFQVSSKTGHKINEAFQSLTNKILVKNKAAFSKFCSEKSVKLIPQKEDGIKMCEC